MDLILVIAFGAIVAVSGALNPDPKGSKEAPETQVVTPVIKEPEPTPEPAPT